MTRQVYYQFFKKDPGLCSQLKISVAYAQNREGGNVEVKLHAFVTSALDSSEWSASRFLHKNELTMRRMGRPKGLSGTHRRENPCPSQLLQELLDV